MRFHSVDELVSAGLLEPKPADQLRLDEGVARLYARVTYAGVKT